MDDDATDVDLNPGIGMSGEDEFSARLHLHVSENEWSRSWRLGRREEHVLPGGHGDIRACN